MDIGAYQVVFVAYSGIRIGSGILYRMMVYKPEDNAYINMILGDSDFHQDLMEEVFKTLTGMNYQCRVEEWIDRHP